MQLLTLTQTKLKTATPNPLQHKGGVNNTKFPAVFALCGGRTVQRKAELQVHGSEIGKKVEFYSPENTVIANWYTCIALRSFNMLPDTNTQM